MTKNDQKMQNFSLFVAKLEKIHKKKCLQHIIAPSTFWLLHLPLKIGYIHNIHWCKGPEIKNKEKKATKRPKNVKFVEQ